MVRIFLMTLLPGFCIAAISENLASGGKASQSSMYNYNMGAAQKAIDGNKDPVFMKDSCSHTATQKNPWWRLELTTSYSISTVSITNRKDCCSRRIEGAQIRIGSDLQNNGNDNELATTVDSISSGGTKTFTFKPIVGQYVNIFLPGNNKILTLCEVEVFAGEAEVVPTPQLSEADAHEDITTEEIIVNAVEATTQKFTVAQVTQDASVKVDEEVTTLETSTITGEEVVTQRTDNVNRNLTTVDGDDKDVEQTTPRSISEYSSINLTEPTTRGADVKGEEEHYRSQQAIPCECLP